MAVSENNQRIFATIDKDVASKVYKCCDDYNVKLGKFLSIVLTQWFERYDQLTAEGIKPKLEDVLCDTFPQSELSEDEVLWKPVKYISSTDLLEREVHLKYDPSTKSIVTKFVD